MSQEKVNRYKEEKSQQKEGLAPPKSYEYSSKDCSICCVCGGSGMDRLFGIQYLYREPAKRIL